MRRIRLLWVGKTRERYLAEGIEAYLARLRPMARVEVVEVRDERGTDPGTARLREGARILRAAGAGFVLLDEGGDEMGSRELAAFAGTHDAVTLVVGGAWGVSEEVRRAAGSMLSLSRMTLTHEMARLVLLEQIYRALMIQTGREGYHH